MNNHWHFERVSRVRENKLATSPAPYSFVCRGITCWLLINIIKKIVIEQYLCWLTLHEGVTMRPPFEGSIYI